MLVAGLGEVVAPPVIGSMYDLFSDWHDRHPELYPLDVSPLPGPDLDPRVPMHADDYPYATRPGGIRAGEPFPEFFGAQWGAVARFLGLDLIHFRDGFLGPLLYTRVGPYGTAASGDPEENRTWTAAVRRLFRAAREARPEGLVMAYSSGISGTAEWSTGCVDLEAIVADGALDIFVDQTWGGAWQDWWDDLWKGWTFQLAYLLGHAAQIEGGNAAREARGERPCRRYKLIETWDGWEPWDTLHDVPGKLAWACWAFAHAATVGPGGRLDVPGGTYISWMNDWNDRLIGRREVAFLVRHLDAAERSAARLEAVYGPLLVYNRAGLLAKGEREPETNASEWIEDHVGMAMKWGAPVIAGTRPEWLPSRWPEGAFLQLPVAGSAPGPIGGPRMAVGRADLLDPALLAEAGLALGEQRVPAGYRLGTPTSPDLPREERVHLPEHAELRAGPAAWVGYASHGRPLLAGGDDVLVWQPPDLADPGNALIPRSQIGTVSPYVEAYRAMARRAAAAGGVRVEPVAPHEPVAVHCWRSDGAVHVLAGNLESRWLGDARFPRRATVVLPRGRLGIDDGDRYALWPIDGGAAEARPIEPDPGGDGAELRFTVEVPAEGFLVARLERAPAAGRAP
ncbi:MAG: hypothetical protein A2X23_10710 [Chloroflexi bacterium GWC2_73_18]|nr:MAG: hypothetical protein A2X23_10710 [Chloroflexi bacterium GWC2_73_18]